MSYGVIYDLGPIELFTNKRCSNGVHTVFGKTSVSDPVASESEHEWQRMAHIKTGVSDQADKASDCFQHIRSLTCKAWNVAGPTRRDAGGGERARRIARGGRRI
jgi:hypothetical protein